MINERLDDVEQRLEELERWRNEVMTSPILAEEVIPKVEADYTFTFPDLEYRSA